MSDIEQAEEVEVIEEQVELDPSQTGMIKVESQDRKSAEDIFWLAENIDRMVDARNKIVTAMLKLAKPGDWVSFSSAEDKDGTASLGYAGAIRISSNAGISFLDRKIKKIIGRDKIGEWYRYECEVTCIFRNTQVRTWGRAGSRDAFFGRANKVWKDLSEINEGNCKMAAIHGAMKEGVKVLLGIPSFPIKELMAMGLNIDFTKGHEFAKPTASGETTNPIINAETEANIRAKLWDILCLIAEDDENLAQNMLQEFSSFQGKDGPVKGKRDVAYLKGGWLTSTYGKAKTAYQSRFGKPYAPQAELAPQS